MDGAVHVGLAEHHAGIVDEIARREIVGPVQNDVVVGKDRECVLARQLRAVGNDLDVRIDFGEAIFGRVQLRPPDVRLSVEDLAMEVRHVDVVEVDEPQLAHPGGGQVERHGRAQSPRAHDDDSRGLERPLALEPDFGQHEVTRVA